MNELLATIKKPALLSFLLLSLLSLLVLPNSADAETVFRYGSEISLSDDQRVDGDLYAFSGNFWTPQSVNISGAVNGDLLTIGDTITLNGTVAADVAAAGFSVQIHGPVGDDIRAIGGKVVIAEEVSGDVFVIAEKLDILSSADIKGNVYFYGSSAEIAGTVEGSLHGHATKWRIDGLVGAGADITAVSELTLGDRASVVGDLSYKSNNELVRSTQSAIEGDILRQDMGVVNNEDTLAGPITTLFAIMFACFFLYLLTKRKYSDFTQSLVHNLPRNFIVGTFVLFLAPFVSVFLVVTVLGSVIGFSLLFLYLLGVTLSMLNLPVVFGVYARKLYDKKTQLDLLTIAIGAAGLLFMLVIPVLGPILMLAFIAITLGELSCRVYQRLR